jgi:hypothetical protein
MNCQTYWKFLAVAVFTFLCSFAGGVEWASRKFEASQLRFILAEESQLVAQESRMNECEAKFRTYTVLIEPRAAASIPMAHGGLALSILPEQSPQAVWVIPAQVQPYSSIPNAKYIYGDPSTLKIKGGPFDALPFKSTTPEGVQ